MDEVVYDSPIGLLRIAANDKGLTAIRFPQESDKSNRTKTQNAPKNPHLKSALQELGLYFEGKLLRFKTRLAADGTEFQSRVWEELRQLPYGSTASYGEIAERIGNPKASRAVGLANNRNPISILVPCHRVIGKSGKLVGYGGEIWRKEWLLKHEGASL